MRRRYGLHLLTSDCPCGSGTRYDACCGRLHRGAGTELRIIDATDDEVEFEASYERGGVAGLRRERSRFERRRGRWVYVDGTTAG